MLFTPIPFRLEHSGAMESLQTSFGVECAMDELARSSAGPGGLRRKNMIRPGDTVWYLERPQRHRDRQLRTRGMSGLDGTGLGEQARQS
jgi:CO/xanthine dehydrogenase Mo-binding subunit